MKTSFAAGREVRPGSVLRLVAPSGPFDKEAFDRGVQFLKARYEVRFDDRIFAQQGYLAGDDDRRHHELVEALNDTDADAIVAARGGYGSTRLLERLDTSLVRQANKRLVGFSDITALHALWSRAALESLHAPMVAWLGNADEMQRVQWVAALERTYTTLNDLTPISDVSEAIQGPLVGGNLAVLAALVGTPYAPPLTGAVLFLEDVGEAPYRVDRTLTTLRHAGWFDRVAGVLLGEFVACTGKHAVSIESVLKDRLGSLSVPVLSGAPSGHGVHNRALPFGHLVELDPLDCAARFA